MACRLFGTKLLSKTTLECYQMDPQEQTSAKFDQNTQLFFHGNASAYIVCEMAAILSKGRWVNPIPIRRDIHITTDGDTNVSLSPLCVGSIQSIPIVSTQEMICYYKGYVDIVSKGHWDISSFSQISWCNHILFTVLAYIYMSKLNMSS